MFESGEQAVDETVDTTVKILIVGDLDREGWYEVQDTEGNLYWLKEKDLHHTEEMSDNG